MHDAAAGAFGSRPRGQSLAMRPQCLLQDGGGRPRSRGYATRVNDLQVLQRLEALTGLTVQSAMRRAVSMASRGLGAKIRSDVVRQLSAGLPTILATPLRLGVSEPASSLDGLYARVGEASGTRLGVALELTQTVFAVIAELASSEAVERARNALPHAWAELLHPPVPTRADDRPPAPHGIEPGSGHTLATGRQGSHRPLAGSLPPRGQHDSVASTNDPHADTKLSASRGLSTERHGETLADGRPGSIDHPLSDAD